MSALQVQREQILADAKFEIKKYEEKDSFDEKFTRNLRRQIGSRGWDLRCTLVGFLEASQAKDRLQHEVSDKERAPHEDRLRGFREGDAMKRNDEFDVDKFSRTKSQENQNTINNVMNRVRQFQCEISNMHDSMDFKVAESMHSGPVKQRYFFSKMIEEDCWAAPKLCRLMFGIRILHRETFLQVHLHILRHPFQGYPHHGTIRMLVEFLREPVHGNL